jgi:hypothetical protein
MIYSIAVLELADFEGIGRKMPKGKGVDATVNNGARACGHVMKRRKVGQAKNEDSHAIIKMLREGDKKDQQLVALRIFFESGNEEEKQLARNALFAYAFPATTNSATNPPNNTSITLDDSGESSDSNGRKDSDEESIN